MRSLPRPRAQQKRSQRTFDELLKATSRVLDREGLEGATIPNIIAEAKLSAGSIYRRFGDKDNLLRATFLHIFEAAHTVHAKLVHRMIARDTLSGTIDALIAVLLKQYRDHPKLLSALNRMIESEPHSAFTKQMMRLSSANLEQLANILLRHRSSMRHPNPKRASRFAVLSASSSIELAVLGGVSQWRVSLRVSDKIFAAELSRQMSAYLQGLL